MPYSVASKDLQFLHRVDAAWRSGDTQDAIAEAEEIRGGAGPLQQRLARLGFKFARQGGHRLVAILGEAAFADLVARGDLVSAEAEAAAA